MYKAILAVALIVPATSALAQIKIPYFQDLNTNSVCGGFSPYCAPTSSQDYHRVRGLDYSGDPADYLGLTYKKVLNRASCGLTVDTGSDIIRTGQNTVVGKRTNERDKKLTSSIDVALEQYLAVFTGVLPPGLKAALKTSATDKITKNNAGNVQLKYERIDLKNSYIMTNQAACLAAKPKNHVMITGISVITVSGDWAKDRLVEAFGELEAGQEFAGLTGDQKGDYNIKKNLVLNGTFAPFSFVTATAWRK